jgi:hypothetical protein
MDPLLLRFLERLVVVLIGGMAVYFGYRLFLNVPEQKDSSGKVVLPWDISIVMNRVGPGIFFALFGVVVVGLALIRPLEINATVAEPALDVEVQSSIRYAGGSGMSDPNVRVDARALLRKEIAVLNTIPNLLRANLPNHERDSIALSIRNVKLALLKPVWGDTDEGFGDFFEFERWVRANEPLPSPAGMEGAMSLYRYGQKASVP